MSMRKERKYSERRNTVKEKKTKKKIHYMSFDWGITWDKFKNWDKQMIPSFGENVSLESKRDTCEWD